VMELGATLCTPRSPRCAECPLSRWCTARRLGLTEKIPAKRAERPAVKIQIAAAVLLDPHGHTLLVKPGRTNSNGRSGPDLADLFSRMWQFPAIRVRRSPRAELAGFLKKSFGSLQTAVHMLHPLRTARHAVTYRALTLRPYLLRVEQLPHAPGSRRPALKHLGGLPVSSATRKIAAAARD